MRGIRLRACRTVLCIGLSAGMVVMAIPTVAAAQSFPADGWFVLTQTDSATGISQPIGDQPGDSPGPRDIVGSAEYPMAYVQSDSTHLYFRLRINDKIMQMSDNLRPYGWGCVIDVNGDTSNYEYSAILDGVSNPDAVRVWHNTSQGMPNNPSDPAEVLVHAYLGLFTIGEPGFGYAREVLAPSNFPTGADYFADWAIERSKLGIGPLTPLRFACGTAADGTKLSQDFSGPANLPDIFSDPVICDATGCYLQNCAGAGTACSLGIGGCEGTGVMVCNAMGAACNAVEGAASTEICDGIDNNCDGDVDEGNPGSGMTCASGLAGLCSAGITACVNGALLCNANVMPGTVVETCNGIDDNCNGIPDDGPAGGGQSCVTGLEGVCAAGFMTCANGADECTPVAQPGAQVEACNGVDDDCDGKADEDFATLGQSCTVGTGACAATGQIECDTAGGASCSAIAGSPNTEICGDSVDSDCDGNLDNNCPDSDNDGIPDHIETQTGTDPNDADTDDDGVRDGSEPNWDQDSDNDGTLNVLDPDSDDDGLFDGTEMGLDCGDADTDPTANNCIPDADGGTTVTDPLDADTDDGTLPDGKEDTNRNGALESGEKNPLDPSDDVDVMGECAADSDCNAGEICVDRLCTAGCRGDGTSACPDGQSCTSSGSEPGVCEPVVQAPGPVVVESGGCGACRIGSENSDTRLPWALALFGALALRRKRR